jgi:hypothetical protein
MANFESTTGMSIQEAFEKFDKQNNHVYLLFKRYTREAIVRKKAWTTKGLDPNFKTSAKLIINRIRWEIYFETNSQDGFRINDAFACHYARKFAADFPDFKEIFNYRELRSK